MNASKVLNEKSLDSAFSSHFMKDPVVNFEEEVENTVERINSKVLTLSDEFKEDLILDKKLQTEVDNYKKSIEKLEKQWIKELNINDLEEKLNKAKKELQKRLKKEEIKFNLTEKKIKTKIRQ